MRYILFGCGANASCIIKQLKEQNCEIVGVVDNNKTKWGQKIEGYEISSPKLINHYSNDDVKIIITVSKLKYNLEIKSQLIDLGKTQGRDFFDGGKLLAGDGKPGRVSGEIALPQNFKAGKTFDSASRLVFLKDEKRIFRMVESEYEEQYRMILNICKVNNIFGNYLVWSDEVENKWELPCSMLIEHQYIEPITYSYEWTPKMFKDYICFMLDFICKLTESSLSLIDGHHLNATIFNGRFLFFDFGAIREGLTSSSTLIEILNMHFIPLIIMERGEIDKAYACLKNSGIQYTLADVEGYLLTEEKHAYYELLKAAVNEKGEEEIIQFLKLCKIFVNSLDNNAVVSAWSGYQNDEWNTSDSPQKWSVKMINVINWLRKIQPETVLDVAGNMGWYGSYLHEQFKYSIINDMDINCLNTVWDRCIHSDYKNVYPVFMSFVTPTPSMYRDAPIDETLGVHPWINGAVHRMSCDVVLALAIVHHLAFRWQMTFDEIVGQLSAFSKKYIIVEFVDKNDRYLKDFVIDKFRWYTRENFEKVLAQHFMILATAESLPKETRTLYLCEKIS